MTLRQTFLTRVDAFCFAAGISRSRLASVVMNNNKFFGRVEAGHSFTDAVYERFMAYIRANWPEGLARPDWLQDRDLEVGSHHAGNTADTAVPAQ